MHLPIIGICIEQVHKTNKTESRINLCIEMKPEYYLGIDMIGRRNTSS